MKLYMVQYLPKLPLSLGLKDPCVCNTETKRSQYCLVKPLKAGPALPQQILKSKTLVIVRAFYL